MGVKTYHLYGNGNVKTLPFLIINILTYLDNRQESYGTMTMMYFLR